MSVYRAAVCEDEEILRESIAGACREILDGWAPGPGAGGRRARR